MVEVNSLEVVLPHSVIDRLCAINTGENVSWQGRVCSHQKDFRKTESPVQNNAARTLSQTQVSGDESDVSISATKLDSGLLSLTFSSLNLSVLEGKLGCSISEVEILHDSFLSETHEVQDTDLGTSAFCDKQFQEGCTKTGSISQLNDSTDELVKIAEPPLSSDLPIKFVNSFVERPCNLGLSSFHNDSTHQPMTDTSPVVVKRKRGRPRKIHRPVTSTTEEMSVDNTTVTEGKLGLDTPGKRYSLRGVKLRKDLMDAERNGSDEENDIDDMKTVTSACVTDTPSMTLGDSTVLTGIKAEQAIQEHVEELSRSTQTLRENNRGKNKMGSFPRKGAFRRKRNNVKIANCKLCAKMFCDFTGVEEHVRKFHSSDKNFKRYIEELQELKVVKCLQCDRTFKHRYALQIHEDIAHCKYAGSSCGVCKKKFKSLRSLRVHERMVHNSGEKEHLCHLCPAKFKWSNTLKQHIEEIHDGIQNFMCILCDKKFSRKGQLNRHMRIHGTDNSKRVLCNQCGKGFWYGANLQRHLLVHQAQSEKYHCSYCGKGFTNKDSMVSHVRLLHFKLHRFICKQCNITFPRSKLLEDHMKAVHGEDSYKVSVQRQRFKYNRTADDLFYCTYCSSSFFYKAKMVEHIHKTHANEFPFVCTICNQGFLMRSFLKKHKKAAHGQTDSQIGNVSEDEDQNDLESSSLDKEKSEGHLSALSDPNGQSESVAALLSMTHSGCIDDMDDFELSDAAAAASLLVEVASGNMTTHYVIQNSDHVTDAVSQPGMMGELSAEQNSIVQIITADNGSTQVVLPSTMDGENYELVESFAQEAILHAGENVTVLSEPVEDAIILTDDNLQFDDNINGDVPLNVVVVESES